MNDPRAMLSQHFGFSDFRPGQEDVIAQLLGQGRALAVFPTGGGKSLCYQLPALLFDGTALVVSPLIALMKDQIDFLRGRGISAARLDSTLDSGEAREVSEGLRHGTLKLLYVSPERFNNERFRAQLASAKLSLFAVDEAHCISEWGHNFRPDYLKLAQFAHELKVPRILALTATATPRVQKEICEGFSIPRDAAVVTGFYRPNLNMALTPVAANKRSTMLLSRLQKRKPGATIVYVTLQRTAESLASFLQGHGLAARAYHAGMQADERAQTQEWWKTAPDHIVVATIAFGMGIDKADVRYVYHYNLPKGLESYAQEIGRAGRDGLPSTVETFACADDVPTLENFAYGDTPTEESLRGLISELLSSGGEFSVKETDLSARHDLRPLVLRTALTYLELMGVLRQGTPYYAGYEARLFGSLEDTLGAFGDKAAAFLRDLFKTAKLGQTWWKIDPDHSAQRIGCPREHVVRAMEMLEARGVAEVRAADVRSRYTLLADVSTDEESDGLTEELVGELGAKFKAREDGEIARIEEILNLVQADECQTNFLVGYFGEQREESCRHCSWCARGPVSFPPAQPMADMNTVVPLRDLRALKSEHPDALSSPRALARLLCGLSSPALSRAKVTRHALFGKLEAYRFADVLAWCETV